MKKTYLHPQCTAQEILSTALCADDLEITPSAAGWETGSGEDIDEWDV